MVHTAFLYRINVVPACISCVVSHTRPARSSTLVVHTLLPRGSTLLPLLPRGSALLPRCLRVAFTSLARFGCESETIDLLVFLRGFEDGSLAASVSTVFTGRPFGLTGFSLVSLSLFCLVFS